MVPRDTLNKALLSRQAIKILFLSLVRAMIVCRRNHTVSESPPASYGHDGGEEKARREGKGEGGV